MYSSTRTILQYLNEQIVKDTIIRFDDLLPSPLSPYPNWMDGEEGAFKWVTKFKREIIQYQDHGNEGCTVLVKIKEANYLELAKDLDCRLQLKIIVIFNPTHICLYNFH